jgi:peptidoglycan/xylan/chitin deacetylase (PgdA/CDA1 family)
MRLISPVLKHVIYPGLARAGYFERCNRSDRPVVITYHGILPAGYVPLDPMLDGHLISATSFRAQLGVLKKKYNIVTPEEFRLWIEGRLTLPPRAVLLTCDDGRLNVTQEMLAALDEMHLQCLFFVTGASLDGPASMLWHEHLFLLLLKARPGSVRFSGETEIFFPQPVSCLRAIWRRLIEKLSAFDHAGRIQLLDEIRTQLGIPESWQSEYSENQVTLQRFFTMDGQQLKKIVECGMTVGAHTLSHPMLSRMSRANAWEEIATCRSRLAELLGVPVWAVAYPFGNEIAAGAREFELAREAGFTCAFMNTESSNGQFGFPRIHVSAGMTLGELEAHISGVDRALRLASHLRTGARA